MAKKGRIGREYGFCRSTASAVSPLVRADSTIGRGRKILVVDDNLVVLKAFELKLKACGFEVLTASEGAAAVSTARQLKPDLIVLDINFPPDVGSSGLQWDGFNIMQLAAPLPRKCPMCPSSSSLPATR